MTETFKVTRHAANRWEVTGLISMYRKPRAVPYSRIHTTKRAAEWDARHWELIEARNDADRADELATRRRNVAEYLAARAKRNDGLRQTAFNF